MVLDQRLNSKILVTIAYLNTLVFKTVWFKTGFLRLSLV